eukprot:647282-Pyramimonas_sp.AAC.2
MERAPQAVSRTTLTQVRPGASRPFQQARMPTRISPRLGTGGPRLRPAPETCSVRPRPPGQRTTEGKDP